MTEASDRPHALYIAWGFPPSRGSGVHRALATANGLVEAGFDVTVLTCDRETFFRSTTADTSLEARVDPRIDVVRVEFSWPLADRDIRRWSRARARDPQGWRDAQIRKDHAQFPETGYGAWRARLVQAAMDVHRRRPVDLAVATANPNVDVDVAHQLHLRHGVPFVMDQRDAWTLDVFSEKVTSDPRIIELEAAYVRDAQEIWFVNEPIREWHVARYPEAASRIHVVANGFDRDLAPTARLDPPPEGRPLRFGYVGTITPMLPLEQFMAGWTSARARGGELADARAELWGHLGFFDQDTAVAGLLARHPDAGVEYRGPVARDQVRAVFDRFDALLLVLANGRYVTSGKVFDYMASALPVVSVHAPDVDASRVLSDYPLWFRSESLEPAALADALERAGGAARSADRETRSACAAYAEAFDRDRQLRPRLQALRESVATARSRG
jgi:glycosyltransferase involved in cell wall biosynthesis